MAASPSSSPRLPSPPPIAEDQLGPKSPVAMPNEHGELGRNPFEANASRRIRPGTKAADMSLGPPLVPLTDIDSPFQLTEHLKSLHNAALHRDNSTTICPIDRETATRLAHPPDGVDKYLWLYELCRLLCKEINAMIVALFQDEPPCSAQTCSEMRASEWQYLCAVHDPPKPCCAIDYCCHTLDWTNHVLTSQKNFPSRMALGEGGGSQSASGQLRQLTNIFRRVYRIFAHAWFQHREMYWKVELKTGLYVFFKTVCDVYNLIPQDNYTVPPEAEGIEPATTATDYAKPTIMKRREDTKVEQDTSATDMQLPKSMLSATEVSTTKRHRATPSIGSESITTVLEDPEEEEDKSNSKMEETIILTAEPLRYSAVDENGGDGQLSAAEGSEPPKQEEKIAEAEDDVEVPIIAVEEPSPVDEHSAKAEISPETTTEAEKGPASETPATLDVGEKEHEAASVASDTDSHGSWQVLTNESKPSSDGNEAAAPSTSVTEVEVTEQIEKPKEESQEISQGSESSVQAVDKEGEHEAKLVSGSSETVDNETTVAIIKEETSGIADGNSALKETEAATKDEEGKTEDKE
ncbi:uncharacterized protein PV09_03299 [Verruconis gallopava]|uniref:Mob1/phocein n=1 Tax=Verruconis gallopava TaxID=253628 RepID=A0A0D1YZK6_9PEZI|nr:uncharacterized protein PV09_03299 [Verruconis gallopava]KIW06137.1 hypothetical protein PV09_03299 [Verruconis gallopava]